MSTLKSLKFALFGNGTDEVVSAPAEPDYILFKAKINLIFFILVIGIYILGQCLIGTRLPNSNTWTFSAPIDEDMLYYASVANQIALQFPAQDPAYAGVQLFRPWLTLVPVTILSPILGPYLGMRLLNIIVLLALAYLFVRYFPDRWGLTLLLILATAVPKLHVPSFGTDAIFKGFYHLPFYIAFVIVLFEKEKLLLRYVCLLILPWLHAFSYIASYAFFFGRYILYRDRRSGLDLLVATAGLVIFALLMRNPDAIPPYKLLFQGFYFDPVEPILHLLIWIPFIYYSRNKDLLILLGTTFILASFFHWAGFYFIYMLEFASALIVVDSLPEVSARVRRLFIPFASVAVLFFILYATIVKFSVYVPVDMKLFQGVLEWAATETRVSSVFLIAPPENQHEEFPLIQQVRAVYYGIPSQVQDIGLDPTGERLRATLQTYTDGIVPPGVDFVFYGPFERRRFPDFPGVGREIYRDSYVRVFDVRDRIAATPVAKNSSAGVAPLWGTFETEVINNRKYTNPFAETELQTTFTSPSGKSYHFFGFYDGDGYGGQNGSVWKLRFMCLETGAWTWSATFTDKAPGASGSFECVKSTLPGPLRVNTSNTHWLGQANGKPFLPRWYYLAELLFVKEGEWQKYVDQLVVEKNYNMVSVVSVQAEHALANGWNRFEYEQPLFYPWLKRNRLTIGALLTRWPPRTHPAVVWDKPHLASWHKLDRILRYLQDRGIYLYNFDGFFPNIAPRFPDDPVKENRYLRYALARTGAYWNIINNITFEFSEFMSTSRLNRIGRYIKSIDPFNLLLTVHDTQNFDDLVQTENWIDLANLQYDAGRAASAKVSNAFALAHYVGKPVLSTEVLWEGGGKLDGDQVRRAAWGALLAGSGFLYGEFLPLHYGEGKGHKYLKIMLDFFDHIPYWTMNPHNELVNSGNFCLGDPGKEYVVYAEDGGPISIDLSGAPGELQVNWLNPRSGRRASQHSIRGGAVRSFTPPEKDGGDWVLHLRT